MALSGLGSSGRRISMRGYLILVILAGLLPPIALLALVMVRNAQVDRLAAEESLIGNARVIASLINGTLKSNIELMKTIGSHSVHQTAKDDIEHDLALLARHFRGEPEIVAQPGGSTEAWSVSNLVDIDPGKSARIAFSVSLGADIPLRLHMTADSSVISSAISFGTVPAGTLVAVVDGSGRIITRSAGAQENLGKAVPSWQALIDVGSDSGSFGALAFDGTPISFGFSQVPGTPGWVVVVGVPKAILDARWLNPLLLFAVGCAFALLVGTLLAYWLSRRISDPIGVMVARAEAIAQDSTEPLPEAPKPIVNELDTLFAAQLNSQARLAERAAELALSSQRYSAVAKVGALVTWRSDLSGSMLSVEGWQDLTGQAEADAKGHGWTRHVDADDMPILNELTRRTSIHPNATARAEFRVLTADGDWRWMQLRGAIVTGADGKPAEWVGTLENIDDRVRLQTHIRHLAYHDNLTGLPNRVRLAEYFSELWQPENTGLRGALLYIDLDRFKQANDQFGHAAGDAVLLEVAARLRSILRQDDLAARLGGDEFAVVLGHSDNDDYSVLVANRIVKAMSTPFTVNDQTIEIGASIGIAVFQSGSVSIERLQFDADAALYRAKSDGRNRWAFSVDGLSNQSLRA